MSALAAVPMVHQPGYRVPPQNLEAEQALLGAILVNNKMYERVSDFLLPMHFFEPVHQRIYEAIEELIAKGRIASPVTLKPLFDQDGALADIGGARYLAQLTASIVTFVNCQDYARQIVDLHTRREMIDAAVDIMQDAYELSVDNNAPQVLEAAQQRLGLIEAGRGTAGGSMRPIGDFVDRSLESAEEAYKNPGKLRGLSTGMHILDKRTGGLIDGDLIILGGRSSMGKTALARNIAVNVAKAGDTVGFFILEMTSDELTMQTLATEGSVDSMAVQHATIDSKQFGQLYDAAGQVRNLPLFLNEEGTMSMADIRREARTLKRQHGLKLLIVDYLQLVHTPGAKYSDRVQAVSEVTRALKLLAKELRVPVIALAQLSRALEAREDKRPQLADLRESGSIEQDADAVWFVYREEYYLSRAEPSQKSGESADKFQARSNEWREQMFKVRNLAEVIVGKQRKGPIGKCILRFEPTITKFSDLHAGASAAEGYEE